MTFPLRAARSSRPWLIPVVAGWMVWQSGGEAAAQDADGFKVAEEAASEREAVVHAPIIKPPKIDGDLGDWPPAMARHAIFNLLPDGAKSWEGTDISTSPDLSAAFMVGYHPKEQLLYLGVIVRDDKLVLGESHMDTDAMEIYLDGLCSDRAIPLPAGWWQNADLSEMPVQQYVALPGEGNVYGSDYGTNPVLLAGDLKKTKSKMAFQRKGDVITYEWALQVFDKYPAEPTKLKPGKRIGFDIVVVDKDVPYVDGEPPEAVRSWLYWGPTHRGLKVLDAGNLGEIVLGE